MNLYVDEKRLAWYNIGKSANRAAMVDETIAA